MSERTNILHDQPDAPDSEQAHPDGKGDVYIEHGDFEGWRSLLKNIDPIGKGTWEYPDCTNDDDDVLYDFDDPLGSLREEIQKI
jgi:hypothetical protein